MKKYLILIAILFISISLFAYSTLYKDETVGEWVTPINAMSAGMGSVRYMFDPYFNPCLNLNKQGYYIAIGFAGLNYRETEAEYVFDSYNNAIGKKTTYDNSYFFGEPAYIYGYMPISSFGLTIGYVNLLSKDYNYNKIYRDENYITLYSEQRADNGNINSYFLSLNYNFNSFTIGGNLSIIQGESENVYSIVYVDPSFIDSAYNIDEQFSGLTGGFSFSYDYEELFNITIIYKLPFYIKNERSLNIYASDTIQTADRMDGFIPSIYAIGFSYMPPNYFPVVFSGEMIYENWSVLNGAFRDYNDIIKYHLGLKHKMSEEFSILYGLLYEPYRKDNHIADIGITSGLSYTVNQALFTLAGQYVQKTYEKDNIYYNERFIKLNMDIGINF